MADLTPHTLHLLLSLVVLVAILHAASWGIIGCSYLADWRAIASTPRRRLAAAMKTCASLTVSAASFGAALLLLTL